jgi:hypothetical protein
MGIEEGKEVQIKRIHKFIQQNNSIKYPKSQERVVHSNTGSLPDTKET